MAKTIVHCAAVMTCLGLVLWNHSGLGATAWAETAEPSGVAAPAGTAKSSVDVKTLWQLFQQGGVLMYPILGCSVLLVAVSLERWASLRRGRVIPAEFVRELFEKLQTRQWDRETALQKCRDNGSPIARVLEQALRRWGRPAVEIQRSVAEGGQREVLELRRYLRLINAVYTVAPLLGLLGTVFGMIRCFSEVATRGDALGRPEALAEGIYEALYTTAFGLSVAIPAMIVYYCFLARIDGLVAQMDALAQELVELIAADGQPGATASRVVTEPATRVLEPPLLEPVAQQEAPRLRSKRSSAEPSAA
jgi:biopolymer transport protein ExbB